MPIRCNNPSPLDNGTSAPTKTTVRTAPKKVPITQERKFREIPRFSRVAGSIARGALPIVICLPNNFSVDQAKNCRPHSFATSAQPSLPEPTDRAGGLFRVADDAPESHCRHCEARFCMVAGAETLVEKRPQNPNQNENRNPQRSHSSKKDDRKEHPIPPGVGARLLLLSHQQAVVTSIGLPNDVEDVA